MKKINNKILPRRTRDNYCSIADREIDFVLYVHDNRDLGFGRMMQLISEHWRSLDPCGALSVGKCYGSLKKKRKVKVK